MLTLDVGHDRVDLIVYVSAVDDHAEGIDARGDVLDRDPIALEDGEGLAHEADLVGHVRLLYVDADEVPLSGDAGDEVLVLARLRVLADDGALVGRAVRVLDLDGDVDLANREDGLLLENGGSHVGELAEFTVSDRLDRLWIVDDPWICDQKS